MYGVGGLPLRGLPGLPGDLGYLLHAWTLHFTHPVTGEAVRVEAPISVETASCAITTHMTKFPTPKCGVT